MTLVKSAWQKPLNLLLNHGLLTSNKVLNVFFMLNQRLLSHSYNRNQSREIQKLSLSSSLDAINVLLQILT